MKARVSFHAILRWLERVHRIDLRTVRGQFADEASVALAAVEALGSTVEAVSDTILPPSLHAAVALGAKRIRRDGYSLVCEGGVVVTVVDGRHGFGGGHRSSGQGRIRRDAARRSRTDLRAIVDEWERRP